MGKGRQGGREKCTVDQESDDIENARLHFAVRFRAAMRRLLPFHGGGGPNEEAIVPNPWFDDGRRQCFAQLAMPLRGVCRLDDATDGDWRGHHGKAGFRLSPPQLIWPPLLTVCFASDEAGAG